MIYGVVNLRREARLPLVVGNANRQHQVIDALIDTGFSGFLTLPSSIITTLDLSWSASDTVTLGDGSETLFDIYTGTVIWDGQYREIYIAESEMEPLIGMSALLNGSMNLGFALTLTLSRRRGNKRVLAPFSCGRRVGDEGESYKHSATPECRYSMAINYKLMRSKAASSESRHFDLVN